MFIEQLIYETPAQKSYASKYCEAGQINEIREPFCYERTKEPRPKVMRSIERRRRRINRLMVR